MDQKTPIPPKQATNSAPHGYTGRQTTHAITTHRNAITEQAEYGAHGRNGHTAVERAMREVSLGEDTIGQAAREQLAADGKRLRARLTVEAARAVAPAAPTADQDETTWAAAAVELIHQASLVHDDLMDGDSERRGSEAAWRNYGADGAILLGDHLIAAAFEAAARADNTPNLVTRIAVAVRTAISGQAREIEAVTPGDAANAVAAYETRVRKKSGRLMALPVEAGLITAGADAATVEAAGRAWSALGAAYQIGDDVSELEGRKTGRSRQSDLIQRRLSAPVAHYLTDAGPDDWCDLQAFLGQTPGDNEQVGYWLRQLLASDAPRRCRQHAEALIVEARAAAAPLPPALQDLLEATIQQIRPPQTATQVTAS
jgi:geranylgeranyl pyrophosphate synthase